MSKTDYLMKKSKPQEGENQNLCFSPVAYVNQLTSLYRHFKFQEPWTFCIAREEERERDLKNERKERETG